MSEDAFHVFLSHSSVDREEAELLKRDLEHEGYRVWLSYTEIEAGEDWPPEIEEGIKRSEVLCVYWTKAAGESRWVRREITVADTLGKVIIPLRFDDTPLNIQLTNTQAIEDFRHSYYRGMVAFFSRLSTIFGGDTPQPRDGEPWAFHPRPTHRSQFLDQNHYLDTREERFAVNELTMRLACYDPDQSRFVSLAAVPFPDPLPPVDLRTFLQELGALGAKQPMHLPAVGTMQAEGDFWRTFNFVELDKQRSAHNQYWLFNAARTTSADTIPGIRKYVRFTQDGAVEYVPEHGVVSESLSRGTAPTSSFHLIAIIGAAWKFLSLSVNTYRARGYSGAFELLVNLKGTYDAMLGAFAPGWPDPLGANRVLLFDLDDLGKWRAVDENMQFVYRVSVEALARRPELSADLISDLSHRLQSSFNLAPAERHLIPKQDRFPWKELYFHLTHE